jgi:hypothetical protein
MALISILVFLQVCRQEKRRKVKTPKRLPVVLSVFNTLGLPLLALTLLQCGTKQGASETLLPSETDTSFSNRFDTAAGSAGAVATTYLPLADTARFLHHDSLPGHILNLLAKNNMSALSSHVHPAYPLCISPYAYVDSTRIQCFQKNEISGLVKPGANRILWGSLDGSGDPIRMTWQEFRKRFIWDKNYLSDSVLYLTSPQKGRGNSYFNIPVQFPGAAVAEFHMTGRERYAWMDWSSLYLVFIFQDGRWWLRALVHDQWTI